MPGIAPAGPLSLGALCERFTCECAAFLDNKAATQQDTRGRIQVLLGFFGAQRDVRGLSALDQLQYSRARRAGGITRPDGSRTRAVRARYVEADLVVLHQMLGWACTVPTHGGGRWLDRHPLAGVRRERERNPLRPVASWERFEATRAAMRRLEANATSGSERERWTRMQLALVLAEATGRRLSAIRALRWEDIDFAQGSSGSIRWRAEADKKGIESRIPISAALQGELGAFRRELGLVAGLLFPGERTGDRPSDRHWFDKWLRVAEAEAALTPLEGSLWHAYRRKWASERKHHPIADVAAAGGWKDRATLLECYQQPDEVALLAVVSEPRRRREGLALAAMA